MSHAARAPERPGLRDLRPTRTFGKFLAKRFFDDKSLEGESEKCRVYIGDLNGGLVDLNHDLALSGAFMVICIVAWR